MARLSNRIVAITGASAGIGRATALEVASRGAAVIAAARRAPLLETLTQEIRGAGGRATAVVSDVTSERDMGTLVERAVTEYGRLDVMICNAGIGFRGALDETPPEALRRLVDVNVMGTLYAARAALVQMRKQDSGHIIAVSSIVGRRGVGGSSVYSATKAAQIGLIEGLRAEFVGTNLHASVVLPVSTVTEFRDAIARDFGHRATGKGPKQAPERVAHAIADCIEAPVAEVYPYRLAWWLAVLAVTAPRQADRFIRRFGRRRVEHAASHAGPDT